jgi:flagellin-specific chaperone FliS
MVHKNVRIDMIKASSKQVKALVSVLNYNKIVDYYKFLIELYNSVINNFIKAQFKNIVIHIDSGNSRFKDFELALRRFSIIFSRHHYVKDGNKIKVYLH